MSDIALQPAHALAEAIRRRDVSSRELLDLYLARVDALNPPLNAVVTLDPDGARTAADAADAALARGDDVGPLHGVPMTVKDTYLTAGMRTTCGLPAWDHVPDHDADAVGRLRRAGAVIFGKTNTPAMAGDWQTYNEIFGTSNNPWNPTRSTGGSSGGAAAAVAAGMTGLEVGSDIGGSIRFPSSWCGVCGHKTTWGIVSQAGHLPPAPGTLSDTDLSVVGPIARDVADLEITLGVLAGASGHAALGWRLELPAARATALRDLRLACWLDDPAFPVDTESAAVLDAAATALRGAGAHVVDARPEVALPDVLRLYQQFLYPILLSTMGNRSFANMVKLADSLSDDDDRPLARTARFATQRYRDWVVAREKREQLRALMAEYFTGVDALLMPVAIVPAIPHDHTDPFPERVIEVNGATRPYTDLMAWRALATLAHLPATVVPVGRTASGLPVGIQIVGPYLEDRTTLAVGRLVEELLGGYVPPPGA
jgi:amidase